MRASMEASLRNHRLNKPPEPTATKPDEWSRLKLLLEPVCQSLKVGIKQVIELIFPILQSSRSDESLQGEVGHFYTSPSLLRLFLCVFFLFHG